jgi:pilus assembly protein Flp/PilA
MYLVTLPNRLNATSSPVLRRRGGLRRRRDTVEANIMTNANALLKRLLSDDSGQDLIEYALIAALIALSAIAAMGSLSNKISNEFNKVGNSL